MKISKKCLSIFISLMLIVSTICAANINVYGSDLSGECGDNLSWIYDSANKTLKVSGTGEISDYSYSWSSPWQSVNDEIETLIVDEGVTYIGKYAFADMDRLTNVVLPDSLVTIGEYSFYRDKSLVKILLPNSLKIIGDNSFRSCESLNDIEFPDSVISLGEAAFYYTQIKNLVITKNIAKIGSGCFGHVNIRTISVDKDNKYFEAIGNVLYSKDLTVLIKCGLQYGEAYDDATSTYHIADTVRIIDSYAFNGSFFKNVVIPEGVIEIKDDAFYNCQSMKSIIIPDSVVSIGDYCFECCYALQEVYIGSGLTNIGNNNIFGGIRKIQSIMVSDENSNFTSVSGVLYSKDMKTIFTYPPAKTDATFDIPNTVETIYNYAFYSSQFDSIVLPEGLKSINSDAFNNCSNLKKLIIPDSVQSFTATSIYSCSSLTELVVGNSITNFKLLFNPKSLSKLTVKRYDCAISLTAPSTTVIYGCPGSTAELFAQKKGLEFSALDHDSSLHTVLPTCKTQGYDMLGCDICLQGEKYNYVDPIDHIYDVKIVNPTCTEKGYSKNVCTMCGDSFISNYTSSLGHSYVESVIKPNCLEDGHTVHVCSRCQDTYTSDYTEALSHNYNAIITNPTCTNDGYTTYTCSRCQDSYVGNNIEALGHNYSTIVTNPTCTNDGYTTYTCSRCQYSYVGNNIDAFGHDYSTIITNPTCTNNGYTTYTCSRCQDSYVGSDIEAFGHNYIASVKKPTCTEDGYTTYTCSRCKDTYVSDYTKAFGHDYNVSIENSLEEGEEATYTCKRCDYQYVKKVINNEIYIDYSQEINAGETVKLPVCIQNNKGIMGFRINVDYDSSVLTPKTVTYGNVFQGGLQDNIDGDAKEGSFCVYWAGTNNVVGDEILFYITFDVEESAVGNTNINLDYSQADTFNEDFEDVVLQCQSKKLNVLNTSLSSYAKLISSASDIIAGENVVLKISPENVKNISSTELNIKYNAGNLSYVSTTNSVATDHNGVLTLNISNLSKAVEVTFKSSDTATDGKYNFEITSNQNNVICNDCEFIISASEISNIAQIKVAKEHFELGEKIKIPVVIENNKGIMGYRLSFEYDPDYLENPVVVNANNFAGNFDDSSAFQEGEFDVVWNSTQEIAKDGVLFYIEFTAVDTGSTTLKVSYSQEDTFNEKYDDIVLYCNSPTVTICSGHYYRYVGTVQSYNMDYVCKNCQMIKSVEANDVYDMWSIDLLNTKANKNTCLLDVNNDGFINAKDYAMIRNSQRLI